MNTKNKAVLGHLLALFVTIVWGSAFVSTKVLLRAFHPIEIIIFRFLIAWAVLFLGSPKPLLPKSWNDKRIPAHPDQTPFGLVPRNVG